MELNSQRAELAANDIAIETGAVVNQADLRLKLFCKFTYLDLDAYSVVEEEYENLYCPVSENRGLQRPVESVTLTCDKAVGDVAAGEDLLSDPLAQVSVKGQWDFSVPEWIAALNRGRFSTSTSAYGASSNMPLVVGVPYEFDFTVIPSSAVVAEGDYTFTFTLTMANDSGETTPTYSRTFPAVHLK